jgi:hypothetical protein
MQVKFGKFNADIPVIVEQPALCICQAIGPVRMVNGKADPQMALVTQAFRPVLFATRKEQA